LPNARTGAPKRRAADGVESTGAALMAAGVPALLTAVRGYRNLADWHSQVQLWEAVA
jgi:hypothetical protein